MMSVIPPPILNHGILEITKFVGEITPRIVILGYLALLSLHIQESHVQFLEEIRLVV